MKLSEKVNYILEYHDVEGLEWIGVEVAKLEAAMLDALTECWDTPAAERILRDALFKGKWDCKHCGIEMGASAVHKEFCLWAQAARLETQQARLLAVAVAAKGAVYHMQMCGDESDAQRNLLEALAAVEDLL